MTAPLAEDGLDRILLRHWRQGQREAVTGRDFWQRVTARADWVAAHTRPGALVLVIGATGVEAMALFLGIAAAGRIGAFFPPASPLQDQRHFFEQQRAALAAIAPEAICVLEAATAETVRAIDPALAATVRLAPATATGPSIAALGVLRARLAEDAPLFVQHSSGTTGIKKAVEISGRMLAGQFAAYWPGLRAELGVARLSVATWLPLYHDMGLVAGFLLPVLGGDSISLLDPFEWIAAPGRFFEMIEADGCDIAWMPNFAFRHFVRLKRALKPARLESMKLWVDCSEPCRLADAEAFETAFALRPGSVVGCYAMAETVFAVSQGRPAERIGLAVARDLAPGEAVPEEWLAQPAPAGARLVMSSGRALPGVELAVLEGDRVLPAGHYGEIAVRAPFLFAGYRGQPPIAAWFRTGDLGAVLREQVFVFGRLKEIIIVNGKNLFAGDVEAALGGIAGLRPGRAVAFGLDSDQTGSEELVIVAEHDAASGVAEAACRAAISRKVTETFLVKPRDVRIVADRWLVKSTSGKISRAANRDRYLATFRSPE
ncbi:AMP-binding protein [Falsiroseomonas tokyonensis]|uniref:AMP-binding protein n=1 Tax=Falsiroseomonas tokyonensis TaxID=430521 RepID=A0ABV7BW81_9PROT|nr:AMP-binding protein [Falsiroseomonas tokyonensis]MBU8539921.1 AMP-binding protein [Falsiroseomonas tokyonensis]